jgi:hypothetical protein
LLARTSHELFESNFNKEGVEIEQRKTFRYISAFPGRLTDGTFAWAWFSFEAKEGRSMMKIKIRVDNRKTYFTDGVR